MERPARAGRSFVRALYRSRACRYRRAQSRTRMGVSSEE
ncbi:hypothetical protein LG3211_1487 [Lysobacter gummosus]|nr:hypothetical protein LG3211_1487 [Lysobacter gummosus]